jgi:hypothetical protein
MQKITAVETLLAIDDNLAAPLSNAPEIAKLLTNLQHCTVPKELKAESWLKDVLEADKPERFAKLSRDLFAAAARKPKDVQSLSRRWSTEILEKLHIPITAALTGHVYALYFDEADFLIPDDAILVRKHQFVASETHDSHSTAFGESSFQKQSAGHGSYFTGLFAGFPTSVGHALAPSIPGASPSSSFVAGPALGSLRAADWKGLTDGDLRFVGLAVRAARELLVEAGANDDLYAAVHELTLGLVGWTRRQELLSAVRSRDWPTVWRSATLSDLYFIGCGLRERAVNWSSPVVDALRKAHPTPELRNLGSLPMQMRNSARPVLERMPPYEEFARYVLPVRLAERCSEAKLHIAYWMDRKGLPAQLLAAVAEPLTKRMLQKMQMADPHDWRGAIEAWNTLDDNLWQGVVSAK